jgi:SAM-dependent methyltransferase
VGLFVDNTGKAPGAAWVNTHQSYDPDFFSELARIEDRHFWFRARNQVISALAEQITRPWVQGYRVLEVGCGTGNVLRALELACRGGIVVGMDLYAEGLTFARTRTSCPLVQGDLKQPGFGVQFDMIGAFDVVEHLPDDVRIFRSIHAMLKPRGVLLLTVPAHQSLWSYFDEVAHHCRRYEALELRRKLSECGYEIEYLSQFMASVYPLIWLIRRASFLRRGRPNSGPTERDRERVLQEVRIVPIVNGLLNFALMQEARLIKSRLVLPFGSSLIVAARRVN